MLAQVIVELFAQGFLFWCFECHFANEMALDFTHRAEDVHVIIETVTQGGVYLRGGRFTAVHRVRVLLLLERILLRIRSLIA